MTNKIERDKAHWDATAPVMPDGWTRYPLPLHAENMWDALENTPDGVEEGRVLMVEYRPSSIMGHGMAALWIGPEDK